MLQGLRGRCIALLTGCFLCLPVNVSGQATSITNADVVKMVKAGLSENLVVSAIQVAASGAFDLAPDALIKLKTDGVSDGIIAAMMAKASHVTAATTPSLAAATVADPGALEVLVPENTEIALRLVKPVTSANARVEDKVDLEVSRDVVIDRLVVFKKGAPARGTVTEAANARSFGRSGKLAFSIENVEAVSGQTVRLNTSRTLKGDARVGTTVAAVVLVGVFGGFVKGKNIEVPAGTEYVTYTVGERRLNLAGVQPQVLMPTTVMQPVASTPTTVMQPVAPTPATASNLELLGNWKVTLPNTSATIRAGTNGNFLIELQGQYKLQGELTASGNELSGTVSNACMTRRPITMIYEAGGWTVRAEYVDCVKGGNPVRMSFRMVR